MENPRQASPPEPDGSFRTTRWTVVFGAKQADAPESAESLEALCKSYWPPIYAFLRRQGHAPADAEDLTQAFFTHLFERNFLEHLRHRNGKFRSFLLTFLKNFLSGVRERESAQKRGGGCRPLSLDALAEEEERAFELADQSATPERIFERRWAERVMQRAILRLQEEYREDGKGPLFDSLKMLEPGERGEGSYQTIADQLGMSASAVKSAAHRLRLRHRSVLRSEIAATIENPVEVDEEISYLIRVLGS